jgi:chromosome segregation ATPase
VRSDELLNFGQHPFLIRWIKNFGVNPSKVNKNGFLLAIKEEPSQFLAHRKKHATEVEALLRRRRRRPMMDSKTQERIHYVVRMYSDRMSKQLHQIYSLHYMIEVKRNAVVELDQQILEKQGYVYAIKHKSKEYDELNKKMSDALDRLRNVIQHAWTKLEEVEAQIDIKNKDVATLDEELSRKRKRIEEIDQFVDKVLV